MGEQLSNLDFEGLTQSINLFSGNLARIDIKAFGASFKAMLAAGVQGFKTLGQVIKANPIFLLVGAVIALISYWKELSDFITGKSKMKAELEGQVTAYENQAKQLERINNLAKIQSKDAGQILKSELFILEVKKQQALAAYRLALLEGDAAKISEQRNALDDANAAIAIRREQSAKSINDYYNNALQSSEKQLNSDADKQRVNEEINSKMSEAMSLQISLTQEIQKQQLLLEQQRKMPNILGDPKATEQEIRRLTDERKGYTKQIFYLDEEFRKQQLDALDKAERDRLKALNDAHQNEINARKEFELQLRNEIFKTTATQDEYEIELLEQQYVKKKEEAKKNKASLKLVEEWYNNAIIELLTNQVQRESDLEEAKNKKKLEKQKAYNDAYAQAMADEHTIIETIQESIYEAGLSAQDLELKTLREHYFQLITEAEYYGQNAQALKDDQAKAELAITKKYADAEAQLRVDTVARISCINCT